MLLSKACYNKYICQTKEKRQYISVCKVQRMLKEASSHALFADQSGPRPAESLSVMIKGIDPAPGQGSLS